MRRKQQSSHLLQTTQSKAKMYEYAVPLESHIRLPNDPSELLRLTIAILGDVAAKINRLSSEVHTSNVTLDQETKGNLIFGAQFFDAYIHSKIARNNEINHYLFLLGASAYYLCDQPGSAFVLANAITEDLADLECNGLENLLLWILKGDLHQDYGGSEGQFGQFIDNCFLFYRNYFLSGKNYAELVNNISKLRSQSYISGTPRQLLFVDILFAVIRKKTENASWSVLSAYSGLPIQTWENVLEKKSFIKEFWPAQHLIGQRGVLRGQSAVIQMPTSAGKTKAVELILRSSFLSDRTSLAIIVAPFRALCHEIKDSLYKAFEGEDIDIDELSDVLQMDFDLVDIFGINPELFGMAPLNKRIVVITPEKLLYVLHHTPESASQAGLVIFDEGHQFDNGSRGITYELLLTSLKILLPADIQKVLISAVMSNSQSIAGWLNHNDVVITGVNLTPSFKTVGFVSWRDLLGRIEYVSSNINESAYFVPRVIEPQQLKLIGRERKLKLFPQKNNGGSIALYLGLKLIPNGSIAIFCGQKRAVTRLCDEYIDAVSRLLSLPTPNQFSSQDEITALSLLIEANFGQSSVVTKSALLGIFCHHGNIPQGIRLAIEHAMRENLIKFVICTSTLAQGVNLPIRYLIVADVHQGQEKIKTRDFQNLIGRAGRSGMHTEGSILFANNSVYDNKNIREHSWRWEYAKKLLNSAESEPCTSNLIEIFTPILSDNQKYSLNLTYEQFVQAYLQSPEEFINEFIKIPEHIDGFSLENIKRQLYKKISLITAIESFLLFHSSTDETLLLIENVTQLAQSTLAYQLAEEEPIKDNIVNLFGFIAENISEKLVTTDQRAIYGQTLFSINNTEKIKSWLESNFDSLLLQTTQVDLLTYIWPLLLKFIHNKNFNRFSQPNTRLVLTLQWIDGYSYSNIHDYMSVNNIQKMRGQGTTNFNLDEIVDIFENGLSYDGTLFINALIVLIESFNQEGVEEVVQGLIDDLKLLQKRIKYGLPSQTAIAVCELGFIDRSISIDLANSMGDPNLNIQEVKDILKRPPFEIVDKIYQYPSYFIKFFELL